MKRPGKALLTAACALVLVAGTAFATGGIVTKTLQAQYMGITLEVNGEKVISTDANGRPVEPFAVDGVTYIPARTLGDILGKEVVWDSESHTVRVGEAPFVEDAKQLVEYLEGAHPAFALNQVPEGYDAAKEELLAVATNPDVTLYDFSWAAQAYAASLRDGHTNVMIFGNSGQPVLDLGLVADGAELYLTDDKGAMTNTTVTAIGGISIEAVFAAIDQYFPAENRAGRDMNHAAWSANSNLLFKAGAAFNEENQLVVTLSDGTQRTVGFVYPTATPGSEAAIAAQKMGDVLYVDMNQCVVGEQTDGVADQLEKAMKNGTTKVIIDVRGNGGGNSAACEQLLAAMGMAVPRYGDYVRYSPLALDDVQAAYLPEGVRRGYTQTEGGRVNPPDPTTAKRNPKVKLVVLTDEGTYSSATMMAVFVQDGKLGTVIGRPSANAPSAYGDILYYPLTNTGLYGTVSHIQWQRPDVNADQTTLIPDVETKQGEDALQTALAFLKDGKLK